MSQTLQLYSQHSNGVTYSDPTDPDYTVRFKTTSSPKTLNGLQTTNYVTEVIVNNNHQTSINMTNVVDAVSVRLRVSGSLESMDELKQIISDLSDKFNTWTAENILTGFAPSTAPVRDH